MMGLGMKASWVGAMHLYYRVLRIKGIIVDRWGQGLMMHRALIIMVKSTGNF
jgi:hypothetical protein